MCAESFSRFRNISPDNVWHGALEPFDEADCIVIPTLHGYEQRGTGTVQPGDLIYNTICYDEPCWIVPGTGDLGSPVDRYEFVFMPTC